MFVLMCSQGFNILSYRRRWWMNVVNESGFRFGWKTRFHCTALTELFGSNVRIVEHLKLLLRIPNSIYQIKQHLIYDLLSHPLIANDLTGFLSDSSMEDDVVFETSVSLVWYFAMWMSQNAHTTQMMVFAYLHVCLSDSAILLKCRMFAAYVYEDE